MEKYPEPSPESNYRLNEEALAAELELPIVPEYVSSPPQVDPQVMLARIAETMPWRSSRPGEEARRLAEKIDAEFVL